MPMTERFDAAAFLAGLFKSAASGTAGAAGATVEPTSPADLPAEWRIEWEERAAVREYLGGQAREHAEAEALTEIVARMQAVSTE